MTDDTTDTTADGQADEWQDELAEATDDGGGCAEIFERLAGMRRVTDDSDVDEGGEAQ